LIASSWEEKDVPLTIVQQEDPAPVHAFVEAIGNSSSLQ